CGSVADIRPAFEEDAASAIFLHSVEPALKTDKILPTFPALLRESYQRLGALASAAHQLVSGGGRVADAPFNVEPEHGKLRCGRQHRAEAFERLADGSQFGPAGAAYSNVDF